VWVKVIAQNVIGNSSDSTLGNGAKIILTFTPDAPKNLARDTAKTNKYQVGLTWNQGDYDGGWPV
jgi:hypothetical protein